MLFHCWLSLSVAGSWPLAWRDKWYRDALSQLVLNCNNAAVGKAFVTEESADGGDTNRGYTIKNPDFYLTWTERQTM